jgi:circadian clock protein KaiC
VGVSDRLSSGHPPLDAVLDGGLPAYGINLIVGAPGSGKTILASQFVFHNATEQRPALYLSTVSEPFDKLLRYGDTLAFFDRSKIGSAVRYEDLGAVLLSAGLDGVLGTVSDLLRTHRPALIVIDSFKALSAFAATEGDYRRFLHDLAGRLSVLATSALWVGEYDADDTAAAAEFAVADTIITLRVRRAGRRQVRGLEVHKLRGSGFQPGEHAFRLSADGVAVFPRLADPLDPAAYELGEERVSTGIAALDEVLGDGFWPGSATLVAGPSGCGKTVMGLHFVFEGARIGEPAIFATLQENPVQLGRLARGFGWSFDASPAARLLARSPVSMYIDEWVYELLALIEDTGAKRVVIDSLGDLALAAGGDDVRFREYIYSLLQRCSRRGVSLLMTLETLELFGVTRISDVGVSHLSDNVVLLQYVREQSQLNRALTVFKTRASHHDPSIRYFHISAEGITLGEALDQGSVFGR